MKDENILYSGIGKQIAEKILPIENSWNNKYSNYGPIIFTPTYLPFKQIRSTDISLFNTVASEDILKINEVKDKIVELIWGKNK